MQRRDGAPSPSAPVPEPQRSGGRQGGPPTTVRVVIATDGKRGHENQSRVLARMLGDSEPLIMRLRNPEGGWGETLLRAAFAIRGEWRMPVRSAGERVRELMRPESPAAFRDFSTEIGKNRDIYRIFTVSTGTPPATGNLLLARLLDAEPLCVMTPSLLPRRLFKLMVVPEHDTASSQSQADNVIAHPLALSYHDQVAAELQAMHLARELSPEPNATYWSVAIGGPSKSVRWDEAAFRRQFDTLLAKAMKTRLLITTSRRTNSQTTEYVRQTAEPNTAFFLDASKDDRNPLPAFYEMSSAVAVTDDSFSMVCETIQAGFRPYLLPSCAQGGKLARGFSNLLRLGLVDSGMDRPHWVHTVRGAPNVQYNLLRAEVRERLRLD